MKPFFGVLIFLISFSTANAQTTAAGYYITLKNDTINTQIKIKKGVFGQTTNDFLTEVVVVDSTNEKQKFNPDEIKGYGFNYSGKRYLFVSKPTNDGSNKFLSPFFMGKKASLYQYGTHTSGSGTNLASSQVFYTFEKTDNQYLFLRNILNKKFKSQLKEFFKDNAEIQELIDTKMKYWLDLEKDLKEILIIANRN